MAQNPDITRQYTAQKQAFAQACGEGANLSSPLLTQAREDYRRALRAYIVDLTQNELPVPERLEAELNSLE